MIKSAKHSYEKLKNNRLLLFFTCFVFSFQCQRFNEPDSVVMGINGGRVD